MLECWSIRAWFGFANLNRTNRVFQILREVGSFFRPESVRLNAHLPCMRQELESESVLESYAVES